jgi:hypothetical protein
MKVYVVIGGDCETKLYDAVDCIFLTKEDAIAYIEEDHSFNDPDFALRKATPPDFAVAAFHRSDDEDFDDYSEYWLLVIEQEVV